ncbi:MAG: alkaline phosphatase family protein [Thermoplasmataceae archaeon]
METLKCLTDNPDLLMPEYGGNSILNLSVSIAKRFGVKRPGRGLKDLDLNKKVIMVLLDGFGSHIMKNSGISDTYRPITTVFPSTTSSVLATIATGMPPADHGLIGYIAFSRELGTRINVLDYTLPGTGSSVEKLGKMSAVFGEIKPIASELDSATAIAIIPHYHTRSPLSLALYGGAKVAGYLNLWDALAQVHFSAAQGMDYIFLYVPYIDTAAHVYGPYSEATAITANEIYSAVRKYLSKLTKNYDVLITADHGHIEVSDNIYLDADRELMEKLEVPPYGDVRMISLDSREDITPYIRGKYENLPTFSRKEVSPLFGGQENNVIKRRVGSYVAVATDRKAYLTKSLRDENATLKGHHSSLFMEEMEIPLVIL